MGGTVDRADLLKNLGAILNETPETRARLLIYQDRWKAWDQANPTATLEEREKVLRKIREELGL